MRLALIEALSVERIPEPQQRAVQMMPQLVKQRPEKGAKRDDALLLRRPHPERDQRGITFPLRGFVESVQLAPPGVRQRGGQKLTSALSHRALAALERPLQLAHQRPQPRGCRQKHGRQAIALEIDRLLAPGQPLEVREGHPEVDATAWRCRGSTGAAILSGYLARPAGLHYAAADHGINEGSGGRSAWWGGMPWEATGSRLGMADPPRSSWKPASTAMPIRADLGELPGEAFRRKTGPRDRAPRIRA